MAVEAKRGCGYRKVGALYLCGSGIPTECDRLPFPIEYCPVCGSGIKFTQGFTWIDWSALAGQHDGQETEHLISAKVVCQDKIRPCYMCDPHSFSQPYGLMWVGESFYTPQHFIEEAIGMGVSKKIPFIPKELKLGETVVLLAHKKAIMRQLTPEEMDKQGYKLPTTFSEGQTFRGIKVPEGQEFKVYTVAEEFPGIFYAFRPTAVEMLHYESELTEEKREELLKRGITPISIPDGDIDHSSSEKVVIALDPVTKKFSRVLLEE